MRLIDREWRPVRQISVRILLEKCWLKGRFISHCNLGVHLTYWATGCCRFSRLVSWNWRFGTGPYTIAWEITLPHCHRLMPQKQQRRRAAPETRQALVSHSLPFSCSDRSFLILDFVVSLVMLRLALHSVPLPVYSFSETISSITLLNL